MHRIVNTVLLLVLSAVLPLNAKNGIMVWNHPVAERNYFNHDGYFSPTINVTKVETSPSATILHMAVSYRPIYSFGISSKAYIKVGPDSMTVTGAEGIGLDKEEFCRPEPERHFTLSFPPLPTGTEEFDFHSGTGFDIIGITDASRVEKKLLPSNWRNDATGEWEIGFFDEGAIYDSRFWNYVGDRRPDNSDRIEISDGKNSLTVRIGRLKNGSRDIKIGDRNVRCSKITGRTLPPYPVKDESASFRNNGYLSIDTVVISGWLKDMPRQLRDKSEYYGVGYTDIFTGEDVTTTCKVDSIGRFTVKIPVRNSTGCYMDWEKTFIRTCIEPGETYFLFYDFGRGQKLFMGKNCRLQNELLAHPLPWNTLSMGYNFKSTDYDRYLSAVDSLLTRQSASLDSLCDAVPSLSQRFRIYQKDHLRSMHAMALGQSRFKNRQFILPDNMVSYIKDNLWQAAARPYSLHRETSTFVRDFVDDYMQKRSADESVTSDYLLENMDELGFSADELAVLKEWKKVQNQYEKDLAGVSDSTQRKEMSKRYTSRNAGLLSDVERMLNTERCRDIIMSEAALSRIKKEFAMLDSLDADTETKNIWLAQKGFIMIDSRRRPLQPRMMRFLEDNITFGAAIKMIRDENQKYADLEKRVEETVPYSPVATADISDSDDGETILKKIIAPHKGKIVLLDIWGTWCAPCRDALSKSQELYSQLKDYDMVYIYMANNSPESSWRNIIEQYNVKGDNCFHYNLPDKQQSAVEAFLKVNSFPSYRLFDRNGTLLQVNANPRELEQLKSLIDRLVK